MTKDTSTQSVVPIRVLICDDHKMVAEAMATVLNVHDDIEVVDVVGSAAAAHDSIGRLRPDVVLMDFGLPDQDGARATKSIKTSHPDVKVVIVTALEEEHVLLLCIEAGCSGYLTKDRAVAEVVNAVRAVAAGEALISPQMLARLLPRLRRTHKGLGGDLSEREKQILQRLAEGKGSDQIAEELVLSLHTIRNHVQRILGKLDAHSKLEAVAIAAREGIIAR